jgi:hypothetical protein
MIPETVKEEWEKRFSAGGYIPDYLILYLGQKKAPITALSGLKSDIGETRLAGGPLSLLAEYRNSFRHLIGTLDVLSRIKSGQYDRGLPEIFMERLKQPFENRKRRHASVNDVLKLMSKINRLHRIQDYLNPDGIEGSDTRVIENLELLPFFGFSYGELSEIFLIVVGHTTLGRVLAGKMNEKTLKPVSDLARGYDPQQAINLLRYCRLMIVAETVSSRKTDMNEDQLAELFDLFESMVRVVINRDMDWDRLMDERISSMGGIHHKIVRKILKMMNYFRFLSAWEELGLKGKMEKESLADYDEEELRKIENVIRLIDTIDRFENDFLKDDPLQLPIFYRKFLNMEFHGTGHLFEKMDSRLVFILLWITVNVARGEVINFNPILANLESSDLSSYVNKVEVEARSINRNYLDLDTLNTFSEQLYESQTTFILGTGFQLRVDPVTSAVEIHYIDMDENMNQLDALARKYSGTRISAIPDEELEALEKRFANMESFYRSHLRVVSQKPTGLKLPLRQRQWFDEARRLGEEILSNLRNVIFNPESIYSDLRLLFSHSPSLLKLVLPEFMALSDLRLSGKIYLKAPLLDHVLNSVKKIQALANRDRSSFQDTVLLLKIAQREFGPMAPGIVGLSDAQIETLENIVERLSRHRPLFEALIQSFIFRDLGLIPKLRERYRDRIDPVDHAGAGAYYLQMENIPARYSSDPNIHRYLNLLVKFHDRLHHIVRGEFSHYSLREVIDHKDKDLFDAFFVTSFIMFSAIKEDLMLEDLATRLFETRELCLRTIDGETSLEEHLEEMYSQRGKLFYALEDYHKKGLPERVPASSYLESWKGEARDKDRYHKAGRMIRAMERIFRLRGIRYVEFVDLANVMVKVPLQFIYKKRGYSGIGYATFEREVFEALRIYNNLQKLPEATRHFILGSLVADEVRIFGFENVSAFMSYENMIKLLLIALLGAQKFKEIKGPACLDFLAMAADINKRYEAVNEALRLVPLQKLWGSPGFIDQLFKAKTGIRLERHDLTSQRVLAIHFIDKINISHKITYMATIGDVEQLKNYYHYSLRSLRKSPFYTEDYEHELEESYDRRLLEITDLMLDQAKKQMELLKDLKEIYGVVVDMTDRALDIGFTEEQRHRLMDLYELRKDRLKREKLHEIDTRLQAIQEIEELKDYWDSIKWYLLNNRKYLGKEFEHLIAKKFDDHMDRLES